MSLTAAIPAATVQSHASNIPQLPDQTLLCACIWLSRQEPDSTTYCQNPVLFRAPKTGDIWLFHTSQDAGNQDGAFIMALISRDNGFTWSEPRFPFGGITGAFVRQPLVVLGDGTWVLPVFYCRTTPGQRWIGNNDISAVYFSLNDGQTWEGIVVPESLGCEGCQYIAFFRSCWADSIYRSVSSNGLNRAPPKPNILPNPNSGICAARLPSGNLIVVFNRSAAEAEMAKREGLYDDITPENDTRPNQASVNGKGSIWGTPRKTLTIAISSDDGLTWKERLSYPSIFVEKEGPLSVVHIAFTFHRQYIKYVRTEEVEGCVNDV
ncbi:glycosyl hydrolase [Colletotrichum caudatum]|nr:glycosyl hydrolase [Colletotrichum caudatum]